MFGFEIFSQGLIAFGRIVLLSFNIFNVISLLSLWCEMYFFRIVFISSDMLSIMMELPKNYKEMAAFFALYQLNSYFCKDYGYIVYCTYSGR